MLSYVFQKIQELPGCNWIFPPIQSIGVTPDRDQIYIAHLTGGTKITIQSLEKRAYLAHVKPLYIGNANVSKKNSYLTTNIPSLQTLTKSIQIDLVKEKEVDAAFPFQIESLLPYPLDSCVVDKIVTSKESGVSKILAFSVEKLALQQELEKLTQDFQDPDSVAPKAIALAQFSNFFFGNTSRIILDLSYDETTLVLMHQGLPHAVRALPLSLVKADSIPQEEADGEYIKKFSSEVVRALYSFQSSHPFAHELPVTFTGPVESDPYLLSVFGKLLGTRVESLSKIPTNIHAAAGITVENIQSFATSIGLALLPINRGSGLEVNLRKHDISFSKKWIHWRREFALYFSCMCILSFLSYFSNTSLIKNRENDLILKLSKINQIMQKEPLPAALSLPEIEEKISFLQEEMKKPGFEFPLHPDCPLVSDVLAFLATHPKITPHATSQQDAIQIENFCYTLVKRPDQGKTKEHYQVRVDLEFTTANPTVAREFHEALIAPNELIDAKGEIKWTMQRGLYKTSFFLKDKTLYFQGERP